jgi:hypothetical protein
MLNYIIAFGMGVIIGQEVRDLPKLKPYVVVAYNKISDLAKDFHDRMKENEPKPEEESNKKK